MNHYTAKTLIQTKAGYTDLVVLKAADLVTSTTDDLLLNIELFTLNKGDIVFDRSALEIVTAAAPVPSANAVVTVSTGRTASSYVDFLAASTIVNSTAVAAGGGFIAASTIGHLIIAADATKVYAQVDITDTDGDLATITTMELHLWYSIWRLTDRVPLEC